MSKNNNMRCESCDFTISISSYLPWKFCPFCGKELKSIDVIEI